MGNPIFGGTTSPVLQKWGVKWSPTSGGEFSEQLQGFDINQMLTLAQLNANNGIICDLSLEKNLASLTLTSTDPTQNGFAPVFSSIVDKWEVVVDTERPELFENPNFLSLFDSVNAIYGVQVDQQFAQVIKNVASASSAGISWGNFFDVINSTNLVDNNGDDIIAQNPEDFTMAEALDDLDDPAWSGLSPELALKFFCEEYFRGRTAFLHDKYRLRHTTMAPSNYAANVADFNVEKIYSIAQLLSEVQSNTLWILPLPGYLAYKILNYPVPVNMPPQYQWGALKTRSNAVTAARGRVEITQEYLIDAIAIPTYGLIS